MYGDLYGDCGAELLQDGNRLKGKPGQKPKVLQKYLESHDDQYDASCKLCPGLVFYAEHIARFYAGDGEQEGDDADKQDCGKDRHLQEGIGDSYCQGVDAGGDGKHKHGFYIHGIVCLAALIPGKSLLYHICADQGQQYKGDPVIDGSDIPLKAAAQKIADGGHQRLEASEPKPDYQGFFHGELFHGKPFADRYGKGVHGQAYRGDKKCEQTHDFLLDQVKIFGRSRQKTHEQSVCMFRLSMSLIIAIVELLR